MYEADTQNTQTRVARELTAGRILRVVHSCVCMCACGCTCVCMRKWEKYTCARTRNTWIEEGDCVEEHRCRFATMAIVDLRRVVNDVRTCRASKRAGARF